MITWGLVSRLIALLTALLVAPIAGGSGTLLSAAASAAPATYTYDASAYVYDAPAQLSSPDIAATYVRGLPSRPEGASGEQSAFVSDHGVAAKGGDDAVQLFRHAGPGELADLKATGTFNLGKNSTGKYFADNAQDASKWGAWLNGGEGGVVSTTVPRPFAEQMMRWEKLDGVGPARFASPEQLDVLNRVMSGVGFH